MEVRLYTEGDVKDLIRVVLAPESLLELERCYDQDKWYALKPKNYVLNGVIMFDSTDSESLEYTPHPEVMSALEISVKSALRYSPNPRKEDAMDKVEKVMKEVARYIHGRNVSYYMTGQCDDGREIVIGGYNAKTGTIVDTSQSTEHLALLE